MLYVKAIFGATVRSASNLALLAACAASLQACSFTLPKSSEKPYQHLAKKSCHYQRPSDSPPMLFRQPMVPTKALPAKPAVPDDPLSGLVTVDGISSSIGSREFLVGG